MRKRAILIIDFINDIAHPKGKIASSAERILQNHVIEKTNKLIAKTRHNQELLLFVKVGFSPGYPECPTSSPLFGGAKQHGALLLGSWGTEFLEHLDVRKEDLVLVKHRVSSFYGTPLETILRAQGINALVIAGTATNMTVEHTARDAHDRDYLVTVVSDATEAASEEARRAALATLGRFSTVQSVDDYS